MSGEASKKRGGRSAQAADAQARAFAAELHLSRSVRLRKGEAPMTPLEWRARQTVLGEREVKRTRRTWHERVRLGNHEALQQLLQAAEAVVSNWPGRRYPESFTWKSQRYELRTTSLGRVIVHCSSTGAPLVASRFFAIN